jgi:hydroxyacyl-ACP dehydratase HTD2-like protein with hotdog domain
MTATTASQPYFDDIRVGDELPPMVKNASRAQLFLYSAASSNPHRIHYDREYAAVEGHPDVLVHGPLQGAWLSQFVTEWMGARGRLLGLSWQNRARALPERDLTFKGRVTAMHDGVVELELWEEDDTGAVLMPGAATVRLPRRVDG